jgi:hypothetical protein
MGEPRFRLTRRELLQAGSAALIASQLPIVAWRNARAEAACEPRPRFFSDPEDYRTLEALVDRLIPEDTDTSGAVSYGAKRAKVADYVDFFLGSFLCTTATPFLYAGGPFSDRNGSATNDMASPVALTPAQRIAWRVLILGIGERRRDSGTIREARDHPRQQRGRGRRRRERRHRGLPAALPAPDRGAARSGFARPARATART